jgi:hypothetical protein
MMKTIQFVFTTVIIHTLIFLLLASAETRWEEVLDRDNIQIWKRPVDGSKYDELKAITTVNARMEVIWELLCDTDSNKKWVENSEEARLIKPVDETTVLGYLSVDLPWPISNRDMVVKSSATFDRENSRIVLKTTAVDDLIVPPKKGYIRVTEFFNEWILQYIQGQRENTRVTYKLRTNPAGHIPPFFVNLFVREQPYKTLTELKKMVTIPKYIEAAEKSELKEAIERAFKAEAELPSKLKKEDRQP